MINMLCHSKNANSKILLHESVYRLAKFLIINGGHTVPSKACGSAVNKILCLHMLHCIIILKREEKIEAYDLVSYSVQRNISSLHDIVPVPVEGYFRQGANTVMQTTVQGMLRYISCLSANWTAFHM